ncbi:MAG: DEAD/DEAH box helicase [Candidatus Nanopelagicales bacterium]|nr:DEAD/DEAH box helicase [Candidatus Nanopelagicales bacterium]
MALRPTSRYWGVTLSTSSTVDPTSAPTFAELGTDPRIAAALLEDGIERAFPIQEMCLSMALEGRDIIGQAKTGTGKTLGFGIPLLQRIDLEGDRDKPQAIVICPTRELGLQVATDLERAGRLRGVKVLAVYGGRAYEPQIEALQNGVDVVVGTPGRIIDLSNRKDLDLSNIRVLVLDEADEMLDMGFLPDVERIVSAVPAKRQTMLFSATMPGQILNLARRYMTTPTHIRASEPGNDTQTVDAIEQHVWRAHPLDKVEVVARVLQAEGRQLAMIFTRTKRKAQKIADDLTERGFAVGSVHGDLGQGAREQALRAFRNGKVDVLVCTDVAARGIDVDNVTHVINYECPDDEKTYVHRIGRTGRAGNSGVAVTLVDWEDIARWQMIDRALKLPFKDPIETYSTSDHLYTGLNIPAGTTGSLPKSGQTREGLKAEGVEDLGETGKKKPAGNNDKHHGKSHGDKPKGDRPRGDRPRNDKPRTDRPRNDKQKSDAPKSDADQKDAAALKTEGARQRRRTRSGKPATPAAE